jgi:3',5'-cyclic AMP phosphodiesterase CpdA
MKKIFIALLVWTLCVPLLLSQQVETTRNSQVVLATPKQKEESFTFAVFADRTSESTIGHEAGIAILKDAVKDTNRLKPAFVMNIGDMVQGYCGTEKWLEQMAEYKEMMSHLEMPWFPTPGNHDIYGGKEASTLPKGQNETNYETHFGPLWYAFEYKNNWFIVLYTDEGNPETGEKSFSKPECQTMSDEQFRWLQSVLTKAKSADGIYVFQHHPRWFGGDNRYGNDWNRIHKALVETGNVKIVFGGHIHRMTYNTKDGIQYVTIAATGGNTNPDGTIEEGVSQHLTFVTVAGKAEPTVAIVPVRSTCDIKIGRAHV